jgi:hypothetical protein
VFQTQTLWRVTPDSQQCTLDIADSASLQQTACKYNVPDGCMLLAATSNLSIAAQQVTPRYWHDCLMACQLHPQRTWHTADETNGNIPHDCIIVVST